MEEQAEKQVEEQVEEPTSGRLEDWRASSVERWKSPSSRRIWLHCTEDENVSFVLDENGMWTMVACFGGDAKAYSECSFLPKLQIRQKVFLLLRDGHLQAAQRRSWMYE